MVTDAPAERTGTELVVGLVSAIGTDLDLVQTNLTNAFRAVDYDVSPISLIGLLGSQYPRYRSPDRPLDLRYQRRMDAGNDFRKHLKHADTLALFSMAAIRETRKTVHGEDEHPIERRVYLLRSLKTKQEVEKLRATYGPNCFVVAAYAPKESRATALARRIAASHNDADFGRHMPAALDLIARDEIEAGNDYGQNVRDTFPLADVFVDASDETKTRETIQRFIQLLFGHPVTTPSRAEFAMFQAYGAALRSASERQVGAAIVDDDGEIISLGTNEVAKAFGGQYWSDDGEEADQRDHKRPNSNKAMMNNILADLIARLSRKEWLVESLRTSDVGELVERAASDLLVPLSSAGEEKAHPSLCERALLLNLIEFFRAVHGEMAALMSAARRGVSVGGTTLYSTTFPCHECARHIVAAGIKRVVFIEPYPKSRVTDLYDDSVCVEEPPDSKRVVFSPFIGIAPRQYLDLFLLGQRGKVVDWEQNKRSSTPRHATPPTQYIPPERESVALLNQLIAANPIPS